MRSAEEFPELPAVLVERKHLTYAELSESARRIAATIQRFQDSRGLTGVFAYRTATAFAGVLGSLLAGNGYVPLNRTFPPERTAAMFERAECGSIIVDTASLLELDRLLAKAKRRIRVLLPELDDVTSFQNQWPGHIFVGRHGFAPAAGWQAPEVQSKDIAYLLFTSGSTGVPKGVMVAQRNVIAFLDYMVERYQIKENDRLSQMFDMTFDLSAFDMFVAWERGACVCCPSQKTLIKPGKFIQDAGLTIWFSVPSTAVFMKQLGMLKFRQYPDLRLSLFCGEPLPVSLASTWSEAAPNSILENLYGPTELTIACTLYRWDPSRSPNESELDIVPIGYPYPGMKVLVANNQLKEVAPGEEGELLMSGPQTSLGYWRDPEKTAAAFVVPPGEKEVYYRTGDRVRRPISDDRPLTHLGRTDFQVKILGHRVELAEIEAAIRKISGLDGVVAVGWPASASGYDGIEVFIEGKSTNDGLRDAAAVQLPDYMLPKRIHFMDALPRNANNKFDRKAMRKLLEEGL